MTPSGGACLSVARRSAAVTSTAIFGGAGDCAAISDNNPIPATARIASPLRQRETETLSHSQFVARARFCVCGRVRRLLRVLTAFPPQHHQRFQPMILSARRVSCSSRLYRSRSCHPALRSVVRSRALPAAAPEPVLSKMHHTFVSAGGVAISAASARSAAAEYGEKYGRGVPCQRK